MRDSVTDGSTLSNLILNLLLSVLLVSCATDKTVELSLDTQDWEVLPAAAGVDTFQFSGFCERNTDGLKFELKGTMGLPKRMEWKNTSIPSDLANFPYLVMTYKADWILQGYGEVIGIRGTDSLGKQTRKMLLSSDDIISDGLWHTVILKGLISDSVSTIQLNLRSRDSRAYFIMKSLEFAGSETDLPQIVSPDKGSGVSGEFITLGISDQCNKNYTEVLNSMLDDQKSPVVTDGGGYFSISKVKFSGIPLIVIPEGNNIVSFPSDYSKNEEVISHFVISGKRKFVAPVSRDDVISLHVNKNASEVFFMLFADKPAKSPLGPAGWTGNDFNINNVEQFVVELEYDDGTADFAFPYSLSDKRHIIQRTVGMYGVPAGDKLLKRLVFHNRIMGKNLYLAAVTINSSNIKACPEMHQTPVSSLSKTVQVADPDFIKPYFRHEGDLIITGNSFVEMTVDLKKTFSITSLKNKWPGKDIITTTGGPGLQMEVHNKPVELNNLELIGVAEKSGDLETGAIITYSLNAEGLPLKLNIDLTVGSKPEIGLLLSVENSSEKIKDIEIRFPLLNGMTLGDLENTWYLFPQYRTYLSNRHGAFNQLYSFSFPMQFYDVYNPVAGSGVYVATREHTADIMRRYELVKDSSGVTCTIEYPEMDTHIRPGIQKFCNTVIGVHQGDWKAAARSYSDWLATWYKPVNSQDKQWYKESFWLLCEYMGSFPPELSQAVRNGGFNGWYDSEEKKYLMRDLLEVPKSNYGRYPDILHCWNWVWQRPAGRTSRFGAWGIEGEYELLGGKDNFRKAIQDIQDNMKIPVSLYMHFSLADKNLAISKKLGTQAGIRLPDGKATTAYNSYNFCHAFEPWINYITDAYTRVNRELNPAIIYIDQIAPPAYFGYDIQNSFNCFADDHGHDVPANFNLITYDFMKQLRDAVPGKTVLYGEFPDVDVNSIYYDCAITYYNVEGLTDVKTGKWSSGFDISGQNTGDQQEYLLLQRFTMPGMVLLNLPEAICYRSWHPLKFTFFNGQQVYTSIWFDYESKAEEFFLKANDIKKKYGDCFSSDKPEMLVFTEKDEILANMFPGNNRNLWTLYNKSYMTIRGEAISVPHTESARYFDEWNGTELTPRIENGKAYLSLECHPQTVGCIVQTFSK